MTPGCPQVLSAESGVPGDLLSFDIFILPDFVRMSLKSSSLSIRDNISPPWWEEHEGLQLSESMSEEGGYFRECHIFFHLLAWFPGLPLASHISRTVEDYDRSRTSMSAPLDDLSH